MPPFGKHEHVGNVDLNNKNYGELQNRRMTGKNRNSVVPYQAYTPVQLEHWITKPKPADITANP